MFSTPKNKSIESHILILTLFMLLKHQSPPGVPHYKMNSAKYSNLIIK